METEVLKSHGHFQQRKIRHRPLQDLAPRYIDTWAVQTDEEENSQKDSPRGMPNPGDWPSTQMQSLNI